MYILYEGIDRKSLNKCVCGDSILYLMVAKYYFKIEIYEFLKEFYIFLIMYKNKFYKLELSLFFYLHSNEQEIICLSTHKEILL